jgi:hypothetical protein
MLKRRSTGWALNQFNTCSYKQKKFGQYMHRRKMTETGRRQPSRTGLGLILPHSSHTEPTVLTPDLGLVSSWRAS